MSDLVLSSSVVDVMQMAEVVVKSGLFPQFRTRESAAALMLLCRAKGLDPMTAVERYHIVQGRPVMRADAMLGEFVAMGGKVEWHRRDEQESKATFSHPLGGSVTVSWTFEMAQEAKLTGKDVWRQYPRQMLHARCVSEGVRSVLPGATNGMYTPEEAANMEPAPVYAPETAAQSRENARREPLVAIAADRPQASRAAADAMNEAMLQFATVCRESNQDIDGVNGKPSKAKLLKALERVALIAECDLNPEEVESWEAATEWMSLYGKDEEEESIAPAEEESEVDPFADIEPVKKGKTRE